jgi:hypothetical protein
MLYKYAISLRAYNIEGLYVERRDHLITRMSELGIGKIENSSIFNKISNVTNAATAIVGAAAALSTGIGL